MTEITRHIQEHKLCDIFFAVVNETLIMHCSNTVITKIKLLPLLRRELRKKIV